LFGDSAGYQIGKGTLKGLQHLKQGAMNAQNAVAAWRNETEARRWIVSWLDTHANYAMTIDMPLWVTGSDGEKSPFHNCSTAQLIAMTVDNLKFVEYYMTGNAKWLNVVQGGQDTTQIPVWWDSVKWFQHGGWAMAGSAGARGGLANLLSTLLMMRDDSAFDAGQDWVHVLGVSTPTWAILLTGIQRALKRINSELTVSFDSSSPFQHGGKFEQIAIKPMFTSDKKTWSFGLESAPQSRRHADPTKCIPFTHAQSPLGKRLYLHHLSVRGGIMDHRNFDSISNALLVNHNIWVYLDAFMHANELALNSDVDRVPSQNLKCLDFIADVFKRDSWFTAIQSNKKLLDSVAPSGYKNQ
jgi:hypothetical protein